MSNLRSNPPPEIPDFKILKTIGFGSYGEVYLARSITGQYRAIKVVQKQQFLTNRPFEREFYGLQKFESISRDHGSQVNIFHVGMGDKFFFYVMELADDLFKGQQIDPDHYTPHTLAADLLEKSRLPISECIEIALSLSTALDHLHQNRLIHRDIKPSNIIFINGKAKLADIGLVSTKGDTLSIVGTEGFIPPEGPGKPQGDLYSLGKVLYESITGMDRTFYPELPANISNYCDVDLFIKINKVIAKCCRHDYKNRYSSAAQLHADLTKLKTRKTVFPTAPNLLDTIITYPTTATVSLLLIGLLLSYWTFKNFYTTPKSLIIGHQGSNILSNAIEKKIDSTQYNQSHIELHKSDNTPRRAPESKTTTPISESPLKSGPFYLPRSINTFIPYQNKITNHISLPMVD